MPSSWGEREKFCATVAVFAFSLKFLVSIKGSIIVLRNTILRGCGSGDAF